MSQSSDQTEPSIQLFVHSITTIDSSYLDADRGLVGETWDVDCLLSGSPDSSGMLMDFALIKKVLKAEIDLAVDHCLLIPIKDPRLKMLSDTHIQYQLSPSELIDYQAPAHTIHPINATQIELSSLGAHLEQLLKPHVSPNIHQIQITLRTQSEQPYYRYSHGLQNHQGNCQRMAHGHRSKIRAYQNGLRATHIEAQIAESFKDIFIATRSHLIENSAQIPAEHLTFAYQSTQGKFQLTLPQSKVYLLDGHTTVEHIATHLSQKYAALHPGQLIEIHAYEGLSKGAISSWVC